MHLWVHGASIFYWGGRLLYYRYEVHMTDGAFPWLGLMHFGVHGTSIGCLGWVRKGRKGPYSHHKRKSEACREPIEQTGKHWGFSFILIRSYQE